MTLGKNMHRWLTAAFLVVLGCHAASGLETCRFVQLCDTQLGMGGYEADKTRFALAVKTINALKVDWVVICGDLVNDGNSDEAVADFKSIAADFTMPVYLAPGNHDVGNEPTPESLARYRKLQGADYYAVNTHGYKLVVVNTQLWKFHVADESEKQDAWFSSELRATSESGTPTIVISHYPPFVEKAEEAEGYYNLPPAQRESVLSRVKTAGVKAWLAGHVHKNIVLDHEGMPIVASATTSKNFDGAPFGFRIWTCHGDGALTHRFEALEIPPGLIPEAQTAKP